MSIFKDTRTLAASSSDDRVYCEGRRAWVNDTATYFNGVFVVPTYLCTPVFADINNYKELLIDSYYTPEQLGLWRGPWHLVGGCSAPARPFNVVKLEK